MNILPGDSFQPELQHNSPVESSDPDMPQDGW